ncbi:MAG: hypothetical protein GX256_07400 [Fretibacterium sp.]|nr:hypothetical protein [Fretibacterium sp.]
MSFDVARLMTLLRVYFEDLLNWLNLPEFKPYFYEVLGLAALLLLFLLFYILAVVRRLRKTRRASRSTAGASQAPTKQPQAPSPVQSVPVQGRAVDGLSATGDFDPDYLEKLRRSQGVLSDPGPGIKPAPMSVSIPAAPSSQGSAPEGQDVSMASAPSELSSALGQPPVVAPEFSHLPQQPQQISPDTPSISITLPSGSSDLSKISYEPIAPDLPQEPEVPLTAAPGEIELLGSGPIEMSPPAFPTLPEPKVPAPYLGRSREIGSLFQRVYVDMYVDQELNTNFADLRESVTSKIAAEGGVAPELSLSQFDDESMVLGYIAVAASELLTNVREYETRGRLTLHGQELYKVYRYALHMLREKGTITEKAVQKNLRDVLDRVQETG